MRTITKLFAMSACMLLMGAPLAVADQSSDEIAEMRAMVEQLQGQVEAQSEQIEHQGEVIREARLTQSREDDSRFGASGIMAFLQRLEVDGHVAASYFWNFNNPSIEDGDRRDSSQNPYANQGQNRNIYPYHGSHNSFQLDQAWFGLEHPIDEENRAGFRFDLVFGTTASNFGNANVDGDFGGRCGWAGDCTSSNYVHQAYIQYLIPMTSNGIRMKAGKFATLVGAEVANTTANFNVTRGILFSVMQPVDHVGVLFDTEWGESGFTSALGVANSGINNYGADPDYDKGKAVIAQLGWSGETFGAATTVIWGEDTWDRGRYRSNGLVDLVLTWDPSEKLSTWLNFDYGWRDAGGYNQQAYGIAVAGRYAVTERLGLSTRFEWLADEDGYAGWNAGPDTGDTTDMFSLTGTADYALTNNLMVRGEVRWDTSHGSGPNDREYWSRPRGEIAQNQVTSGVELVYEF